MAEGGAGTCPQVFVVDSQANYAFVPGGKKPRWSRASQKFLLLLMGLTMLGLVIEGCLIYNLYKKTQAFSICQAHPLCQNLSNPKTSGEGDGTLSSQKGHRESNEIPTVPSSPEKRPFAQLIGSGTPKGEGNVVQWVHDHDDTIPHKMGYDNGRLLVEKEGHYYLYSKLTVNTAEDCSLIQHKVMKDTKAYGKPIELMKSKSYHCRTKRASSTKAPGAEDLWNSFLAGIFHLQEGDEVFVILDDIQKICTGATENLMGAFMISS